jgi:hypothetical protein
VIGNRAPADLQSPELMTSPPPARSLPRAQA